MSIRGWAAASVLGAGLAAVSSGAQTSSGGQSDAGAFDLVAAEHGGRVEWVTYQNHAAMNVLGKTPFVGWTGSQEYPQDLVFSFFSRQSALVAAVLVNPFTESNNDRPREVEIWTSVQSPTEGFALAASATLEKKDALQRLEVPPVEARFVKLRVLSTYAPMDEAKPGGFAVGASRVAILEGQRPGYVSMLARHPELAALAKGVLPSAPSAAAAPVPPAPAAVEPPGCAVPAPAAQKSRFSQSKNVLVITDDPLGYRAVEWRANPPHVVQPERPVLRGVSFSWLTPSIASPAHLVASPEVDTVVFAQACELDQEMTPAFKQALMAWVAAGHKLIIQDSDYCAGSRTPKYTFLPYPFETINPGAFGASGAAGVLENSTLVSARETDASFIDTAGWQSGPNDLGDSNVVVKYDASWCGAMWAKNSRKKNGFALAYAHSGRGLIIYDGFDYDQHGSAIYQKLVARELLQPFDGDHLPCAQPLGRFIITATPELRSQPMMPGRSYTYPIEVRGNFGYSGKVTLDASVRPADPAITVKLGSPTADLTNADEAATSLTVTAAPAASFSSKVVAVRGRDAAGASNVLCLALPERTTGGLSILSALRKDRRPTKNLEIILDASGSMKALLGKKTRWATAQEVLADVVSKLPADYHVGLRVYGHRQASTSPKTCTDTELVVPVEPLDRAKLVAAAKALRPRGETPLVFSTLQTPADLKALGGGSVVLITDGEESCMGDFAAAAKALKDSGLDLTLNIVGFTLKSVQAQADLRGLAQSTGGRYYHADSGAALSRALLLAAVDRLPYRVLDAKGAEVAAGTAGVDAPHELPPGEYTVVVSAGEETLKVPVSIALRQEVAVRIGIKDDRLVVE